MGSGHWQESANLFFTNIQLPAFWAIWEFSLLSGPATREISLCPAAQSIGFCTAAVHLVKRQGFPEGFLSVLLLCPQPLACCFSTVAKARKIFMNFSYDSLPRPSFQCIAAFPLEGPGTWRGISLNFAALSLGCSVPYYVNTWGKIGQVGTGLLCG